MKQTAREESTAISATRLQTTTFGLHWDSSGVREEQFYGVSLREIWSGRRDLNPGPLAPQAKNINHLRVVFAEKTRLSGDRFGLQWDSTRQFCCLWTPVGLHI
jgi:hypothetical protein